MCRKSWMYIAWPSIPPSLHWTPCLGGYRRRLIPCPLPAWAAHRSQVYGQEREGAAQGGVWSILRCQVTNQNGGGRIQPEERSTCPRLPGEASWRRHELRQALEEQGPHLGGEEQGALSRKEEWGKRAEKQEWAWLGGGAIHMAEEDLGNPTIGFQFLAPHLPEGSGSDPGDLETARGSPEGRGWFSRRVPAHPQAGLSCVVLISSRTPGRA